MGLGVSDGTTVRASFMPAARNSRTHDSPRYAPYGEASSSLPHAARRGQARGRELGARDFSRTTDGDSLNPKE